MTEKKIGRPKGTSFAGGNMRTGITQQQADKLAAIKAEWQELFGHSPSDSQIMRDGLDRQLAEMSRRLRVKRNEGKQE